MDMVINSYLELAANIELTSIGLKENVLAFLNEFKKRGKRYTMSTEDFEKEKLYINGIQTLRAALTKIIGASVEYLAIYIQSGKMKPNYLDIMSVTDESPLNIKGY